MEELELLQGTVATVVFQNHENGYAVLRLNCAGTDCHCGGDNSPGSAGGAADGYRPLGQQCQLWPSV